MIAAIKMIQGHWHFGLDNGLLPDKQQVII